MNESEAVAAILEAHRGGLPTPRCAPCLLQLCRIDAPASFVRALPDELVEAVRRHVSSLPEDAGYWSSITNVEWMMACGPIRAYPPRESRRVHQQNTSCLRNFFAEQEQADPAARECSDAADGTRPGGGEQEFHGRLANQLEGEPTEDLAESSAEEPAARIAS